MNGDGRLDIIHDSERSLTWYEQTDTLSVAPPPEHFPSAFVLHPPFPNPFNATTTISYSVPAGTPMLLGVYDLGGRLVEELTGRTGMSALQEGSHEVVWDASRMAAGIYFVRLEAQLPAGTPMLLIRKAVVVK